MDAVKRIRYFTCFSVVATAVAIRDICPPDDLIDPCTCIRNRYPATILCHNFTNPWYLEEVMAQSYDRPVTGISLKDACMLYLPSSILLSKKTVLLALQDSVLVSLFDRAPDLENSVTHVQLLRTRLMRGFRWDLLQTLQKLVYLSLQSVELRSVDASFRIHVSRGLRGLVLVSTGTRRIDDDAFRDLDLLESIQIKRTRVSDLKRSMFAHPSRLYYFDFSDNLIEILPDDMFEGMPRLQEVLLKGNRISLLSEAAFGKLFECNVFRISLEANPLECTCNMRWFLSRKFRLPIHGNCSAPTDMVGTELVDLSAEDFDYCLGS